MPTWSMLMFQDSASPSMEQLIFFHDFAMTVVTMITALIGFYISFISYYKLTDRFLLQSQTTEIVWTLLPVLILLSITLPSLQALYLLDDPFSPSLSVKTIGHQWYWSYEYSDFKQVEFDSYMMNEMSVSNMRLLDTDNSMILPIHTQIRVITSSTDVIHAWSVPSLGMKSDSVPGRLNQLMFILSRPGVFYGQCSEICGANHSFMPIKIEAIPMSYFITWVNKFN
uniref:Cytochrome c oxidase subunit 2 n=1 Tax=Pseudoniphargus gorbeanus TaxID=1688789 RepID=A0A0M6X544_9CRUS|nr:cytochrome c oxidase subunit II [Pseudoniphargus gorbeanus]